MTTKSSIVMLTTDRQIDRRILLQANSLQEAGWDLTIIAMPLDNDKPDEDTRIVRLNRAYDDAVVSHANYALKIYQFIRKYLPMNGYVMRKIKMFTWRYLFDQELFFTRLYANSVLKYSPRIFVAHDLPMLPVAKLAAERCQARLVYDSHELYSEQEFSTREKLRWAQIEAKYIKACDVVITVNQSIRSELENRYDVENVKVILNAECIADVPQKLPIFHEKFELPNKAKILLFHGGLSAGRNLEVLVKTMDYVKNDLVKLIILGDGVIQYKLKSMVSKGRLSNKVYFHPAVPQEDLLHFVAAADVGVIPYQATCLNNYYCTPNKLFEYIAAGVPVITSDLPELRNIVQKYQIGLVGDMSNPKKFSGLIDQFFSNEEALNNWKIHASNVREYINWNIEEQKLVNIYRALQ